jgi:hypothetical protein
MKKFLPALVLIAALATPSVASAANEYTITFSTNPTKSGTKKKPRAVSGKFGFSVRDTEGGRPFALESLRVDFTGLRINTRQFKTCTAASIEQAQSDAGCPAASRVATGFANNLAGNINDRRDASIRCPLNVTMYNSGSGKAALFVEGGQTASPPTACPITVATAIPVSIARRPTGDRLSFVIPENLKTPLATLRNSLVETQLTLLRKTTRAGGRQVGYFETIGNCRRGRRAATVRFDNEGANDVTQSGFARCSS